MINKAILVGRITRDPELRKTNTGLSTVSFTLACNRKFSNQENGQDADFINCVAWRHSADFMNNYVKKGSLLGIEGRIQTRNYKDQTDKTVYVTEVVCDSVQLLESKKDTQSTKQEDLTNTYVMKSGAVGNEYGSVDNGFVDTLDISRDELPF